MLHSNVKVEAVLVLFSGIVSGVRYFIVYFPGTQWVLYCVWVSFVVSALLIIWVKPTYGRLNVDVTSDLSGDAASSSVQETSQEERDNENTER